MSARAGQRRPPIVLTQGDPSGIGPDIALLAFAAHSAKAIELPPFFLLADPAMLARRAALLGLDVAIRESDAQGASELFSHALPVLPIADKVIGAPGQPDPADAGATIAAITQAVELVRAGRACAVVTNPIAKDVLYRAGFAHPGHTEFLGELALTRFGVSATPVMMIWSPQLAVVPLTIHVALKDVPLRLSRTAIVQTAHTLAKGLRRYFGVERPRIACAGLNPHAGESGALGREEIEIIAPAIEQARAEGLDIRGPLPADVMFHEAARAGYDAALCMYHDQALIPVKTLAFDTGVNVTLGLPFIRTSPDHGTAFDIAGSGRAKPSSLIAALRLAERMALAAPGLDA